VNLNEDNIYLFVKEIYNLSGYDFRNYSFKSLYRRIEKILSDYNCSIEELIEKVKKNPLIIDNIVKNITVNTTEFFRDPQVWIEFEEKIIPELKNRDKIKIWHPGCSYGHEAYSMLILLNENNLLHKATIIATDLNSEVLYFAKQGIFRYLVDLEYLANFDKVLNRSSEKNISYSKYFEIDHEKKILNFKSDYLGKIQFYKHDIVTSNYPTDNDLDVIMCRNLLIYFNIDLQNKVIYSFYKSLKINSFLILGYYESIIGSLSAYFAKSGNIYKKIK
jgi:chemotaxis protein methyltransferase CheR